MFANVLAAALRNLERNPLYAAISIASLAIGMAAAILTGLYIRDEVAFDGDLPGIDKVYAVVSNYQLGASKPKIVDNIVPPVGPDLKLDFKEALHTARESHDNAGIQRGDVAAREHVGWSDPDLFDILHLPVVAGDPSAALKRPDEAVITRSIARKYFGQDAPIGQTFIANGTISFRVGAVVLDRPANTNLAYHIWLPNLNAGSPVRRREASFKYRESYSSCCRTYVQVADKAGADRIRAGLPDFFARRIGFPGGKLRSGATVHLDLVPLTRLHLYPLNGFSTFGSGVPQGDWAMVWTLALVASVVLAAGATNFVNLMTARAGRRAVEVGVRKTAGAKRGDLVRQFIGEAVAYAQIAWLFALAAAELALPAARTVLARPLPLWNDPLPLAGSFALAVVLGGLSGVYPALVQSSFRPAAVLKGALPRTSGSALVRSGLTTMQFAALIGLVVAVIVIARQTHFTLNEGLNVDKANMVTMDIYDGRRFGQPGAPTAPPCRTAFADQVRALPGVIGASCASSDALDNGDSTTSLPRPDGSSVGVLRSSTDFGFLELYGLRPLAGRFVAKDHPGDETPYAGQGPNSPKVAVINRMMVKTLGFASPEAAIGQTFRANLGPGKPAEIQVIGVTPDFAFDLFDLGKWPRFYVNDPNVMIALSIKLRPGDQVATLRAIDDLWRKTGSPLPPVHRFVDDYVQGFYLATIQQGWMLDALCVTAVLLACLGLFGLAAFVAEQRTKEIGVRKAMGASTRDIVALLLAAFARPVLWANLIAWPLAWWALNHWLEGFVRHIPLEPWMFVAAAGAALVVAWATVLAHTLKVAAASPVTALRHE
ncbi:MAG: ABC transporter permease [Caulobacteraceae bacterium]